MSKKGGKKVKELFVNGLVQNCKSSPAECKGKQKKKKKKRKELTAYFSTLESPSTNPAPPLVLVGALILLFLLLRSAKLATTRSG